MKLDGPRVALILGVLAIGSALSVWLIARGYMPAAALTTPVVGILSWVAAYAKGKNEMPDFLVDPVKREAARTVRPPPMPPPPIFNDGLDAHTPAETPDAKRGAL